MNSIIKIIPIILIFGSCRSNPSQAEGKKVYHRWVGDIPYNPDIDSEAFQLCRGDDKVKQFFNDSNALEYEGEKRAIVEIFKQQYKPENVKKETGLLRIRFIVNCLGETGRFRCLGMDKHYQAKAFDKKITDQILSITKSLDGWKPKQIKGEKIDYYQYLIFKFEEGHIKEILP